MPNAKNLKQLEEIKATLSGAQSVVIADYTGLNSAAQTELRAKIKEAGGEMKVQKNTLLKIALKDRLEVTGELDEALNGPTAVFYGLKDAVSAVKALIDFTKVNEALKIKAGVLAGSEGQSDKVMTVKDIENLSKLPTRQELLAQLVTRLNSPIQGFANVLSGNLRGLVTVLDAVRKQKAA